MYILRQQQSIWKQKERQKIVKDGELQTEKECHKPATQQTSRRLLFMVHLPLVCAVYYSCRHVCCGFGKHCPAECDGDMVLTMFVKQLEQKFLMVQQKTLH